MSLLETDRAQILWIKESSLFSHLEGIRWLILYEKALNIVK